MMFRDQVGVLAGWFKGWNECEQTVALLSLLKRVSQTQARFLQLCLEHSLADCAELHVLEGEANSPGHHVQICYPKKSRQRMASVSFPQLSKTTYPFLRLIFSSLFFSFPSYLCLPLCVSFCLSFS